MLAFLLTAAIVGIVVVFFLPFIQQMIAQSPQLTQLTANRFIQVLLVGAVTLLGITIFVAIARGLRIPVKV